MLSFHYIVKKYCPALYNSALFEKLTNEHKAIEQIMILFEVLGNDLD